MDEIDKKLPEISGQIKKLQTMPPLLKAKVAEQVIVNMYFVIEQMAKELKGLKCGEQ